jgi:gliding motility-associated-like protein
VENKDEIADLFREKLSGYEAEVRPELWSAVSSQIAGSSATASGGVSLLTKIIISLAAAGVLTGAVLLFRNNDPKKETKSEPTEKQSQVFERTMDQKKVEDVELVSGQPEKKQPENVEEKKANDLLVEEGEINVNSIVQSGVVQTQEPIKAPNNSGIIDEALATDEDRDAPVLTATLEKDEEIVQKLEETKISDQLISLPNVFTPNNDGSNDRFEIKSDGLTDFQLVILNDANKVVFTSSDASFSWDGTLSNGDQAPAGTYLYYLTAKDGNQNVISRSSLLKLIR